MKKLLLILFMALGVCYTGYSQSSYNEIQQEAQKKYEAKKRAERNLYNRIINTWNKKNYTNFLKEFPNSTYAKEIKRRLDEINLWEKAKSQNTSEAYTRYLNETKYNHFGDEARKKRNEAEMREEREQAQKQAQENKAQQNQAGKAPKPKNPEAASSQSPSEAIPSKKPTPSQSSPDKSNTSTENVARPVENREMSRDEILRHCKNGQKYYDADDISSAFKEFRNIPRNKIPFEYLEAYDLTMEYKDYGNLYTKGTPEMMVEFLEKYPDSMVYDDVVAMYEDKTGKRYYSSRQVETLNFTTCRVSAIPNVRNRSMLSLTMVPFEAHSSQTIRIAVTINSGGKVVDAKVISGGSTAQREACLKMAQSTVWDPKGGADQEGIITFNIQPK